VAVWEERAHGVEALGVLPSSFDVGSDSLPMLLSVWLCQYSNTALQSSSITCISLNPLLEEPVRARRMRGIIALL
jgi:hypothetical protein